MRKILSGMLGLIMTTAVVGGVAYAAFSSTAAVEGISISTGTASLLVWNPVTSTYGPVWTSNWSFSNLFPGTEGTPQSFWLENDSSGAVDLALSAKLRNGVTGDWDAFKDKVLVSITDVGETPTDWYTLNQWNAGTALFDSAADTTLAQHDQNQYTMHVKVDLSAGDSLQNKTLSDIKFDFTGVTP